MYWFSHENIIWKHFCQYFLPAFSFLGRDDVQHECKVIKQPICVFLCDEKLWDFLRHRLGRAVVQSVPLGSSRWPLWLKMTARCQRLPPYLLPWLKRLNTFSTPFFSHPLSSFTLFSYVNTSVYSSFVPLENAFAGYVWMAFVLTPENLTAADSKQSWQDWANHVTVLSKNTKEICARMF